MTGSSGSYSQDVHHAVVQSAESIPNIKPLGGHTDDAGNTNDNRDNLGDSFDKASRLRRASVCQVSADIHPVPSTCETL